MGCIPIPWVYTQGFREKVLSRVKAALAAAVHRVRRGFGVEIGPVNQASMRARINPRIGCRRGFGVLDAAIYASSSGLCRGSAVIRTQPAGFYPAAGTGRTGMSEVQL